MSSPIPEPAPYKASCPELSRRTRVRGPRPAVFNVLAAVELLAVVIRYLIQPPTPEGWMAGDFDMARAFTVVGRTVWLSMVYLAWRGANWARITIILWLALRALAIFRMGSQDAANLALTVFSILLSGAWIYFLMSRPVIAFTKGLPADS